MGILLVQVISISVKQIKKTVQIRPNPVHPASSKPFQTIIGHLKAPSRLPHLPNPFSALLITITNSSDTSYDKHGKVMDEVNGAIPKAWLTKSCVKKVYFTMAV
jgi:hypothetical protein